MTAREPVTDAESLRYDDRGLLPVVAQDRGTGAVLMVAWANREAVSLTLETRQAHFFSRSRQQLWRKGETSGNILDVHEILADCDRDTLLLRVDPAGPACHEGTRSCFEPNDAQLELGWLWRVIDRRAGGDPESSYSARLLDAGVERISRKVGEESAETIIAAVRQASAGDAREEVVAEVSDLLYHLVVLLRSLDIEPLDIARELAGRHRSSTGGSVDTSVEGDGKASS